MFDIILKLDKLREERGLSIYKLTQVADISQQTYHNWLDGKSSPTLFAFEKILDAMGVSLGEFFMEGNFVEVTEDIKTFFQDYKCLNDEEKASVNQIVKNHLKNKRKK